MVTSSALTVSQLNTYIKMMFDSDSRLKRVCIVGEISNFTNHYRTGHLYFSLKDNASNVKAVMFAKSAAHIKFCPENGMRVYVTGRISVFDRDGVYQIYVDDMEPEGAGALMIAFEQLKNKLSQEGLFAEERKRPIPLFPKKIAVVTSSVGAAVQDVINVISRRYPLAELILCSVAVQGDNCVTENIRALTMLNQQAQTDLIILCRGGGSTEDLWGYNDEQLVRTVASSCIPVITGIGHETDFSLCDFAADLRAPTPSAAAELAVPDIAELKQSIRSLSLRLQKCMMHYYDGIYDNYAYLSNRLIALEPEKNIANKALTLHTLQLRLLQAAKASVGLKNSSLHVLCEKLKALNPLSLIQNGYAVVFSDNNRIHKAADLTANALISVAFADGCAVCKVKQVNLSERNINGKHDI